MKKILFSAFLIASVSVPVATPRDHAVRGHVKKDGTYVAPTRATNPNSTQREVELSRSPAASIQSVVCSWYSASLVVSCLAFTR